MRRVLAGLLVLSACAPARPVAVTPQASAPPPRPAEGAEPWRSEDLVLVSRTPTGTHYAHRDSLKNIPPATVRGWITTVAPDGKYSKALYDWDCVERTMTMLSFAHFSARGDVEGTVTKRSDIVYPPPGSVGDTILSLVCD